MFPHRSCDLTDVFLMILQGLQNWLVFLIGEKVDCLVLVFSQGLNMPDLILIVFKFVKRYWSCQNSLCFI